MKTIVCGIGGVVAGGYLGFLLACYTIAYIVVKNGTDKEREAFRRIMRNGEEA